MGNAPWFFTDFPQPTTLPQPLSVTESAVVHHAKDVMRLKPKDELVLVDKTTAKAYLGILDALESKALQVTLHTQLSQPICSTPPITAAVSLVKGQQWDWILQKLTEMGVHNIQPLITQHTVVVIKDPENKQARWQQIVQHAAAQSENAQLPVVHLPIPLSDYLKQLSPDPNRLCILGSERGGASLQSVVGNHPRPHSICFAIGPEGGWSEAEHGLWTQAGFHPVHFGPRVYRCETAALSMMALLHHSFDDRA